MEPTTLAKIAVRVVAIYLVVQGIAQTPGIIPLFTYSSFEGSESVQIMTVLVLVILFPLIVGTFLWLASEKLSRAIVGGGVESDSSSSIDASHIQAVAISTIGLIVLFLALPQLAGSVIQLFGSSNIIDGERVFNATAISYLVINSMELLLGLCLVVGANFWVKVLNNFREAGLRKKTSNKRLESD